MIEMRHLRYFIAAVENGSLRRAAIAVHVDESALSRRVRDLEDRLGCSLLTRSSTGVVPTEAGIRFLHHARQVTTEIEAARVDAAIARDGHRGELRVGICFALTVGFLTQLLDAFERAYPKVRISLIHGGIDDHIPAIRRGMMDVAFLAEIGVLETLHVLPLWQERLHIAMSARDPLAARPSLGWTDLLDRTFAVGMAPPGPQYHDVLNRHLSRDGSLPSVECHAVHRDALMSLVARGRHLKITSEATIAIRFPGVVYRSVAGEALTFSAIWRPSNSNPALRRLIDLAGSMTDVAPSQTRDLLP